MQKIYIRFNEINLKLRWDPRKENGLLQKFTREQWKSTFFPVQEPGN